jgi:type IV pilus biogenesis protein PilP
MSSSKLSALSLAALLASTAPLLAQDDTNGIGGIDFLRVQQELAAQDEAATNEPATVEETAPAIVEDDAGPRESAPATVAPPPVRTVATRPETRVRTETRPAGASAADVGRPDADLLRRIAELNAQISVLNLELKRQQLQNQLDSLRGVEAGSAPAPFSYSTTPAQVEPREPQDDTSTLPTVVAILGGNGVRQAELALDEGGRVTAAEGVMLPGGWRVSRIERSAVYVTSPRTGTEYVLAGAPGGDIDGPAFAPGFSGPSFGVPAGAPVSAPAASAPPVIPVAPSGPSAGASPIIITPAE